MDMTPATPTISPSLKHSSQAGRRAPRSRQRGVGFVTLCLYFIVGAFILLGGLKLMPYYLEYYSVKKVIASMATSEEVKSGTVADIRQNFDRRAVIDNIAAVKGVDLEITKENNETVVTAAWQPQIQLMPGYTLLIDFSVSTANSK